MQHEQFDGFIKSKEECFVLLPSIYKHNLGGELVVKALVIHTNYDIPN
jgi:hypothetical protein